MKHRRVKREHGRILSVETKIRGNFLLEPAAAGATQLVVGDAGDFDEDGGWLCINDQVVQYLYVDDDEGLISLAEGLTAAADAGDQVAVWSTLYREVVDYQEAEVVLDGEFDNPEAIAAEVAEGVVDLPQGDRGEAGESCMLLRVSDDEWEIVGVGGRPSKARQGGGTRFWDLDTAVVTTPGDQAFSLTHTPVDGSLHVIAWGWYTLQHDEFTVDGKIVTIPDPDGVFEAGDVIDFKYAYEQGISTSVVVDSSIPYDPSTWFVWQPTSVAATLDVANSSNWQLKSRVDGIWKDPGFSTQQMVAIYANRPGTTGYYLWSEGFARSRLGVSITPGWLGGNMVGARLVGIQFYNPGNASHGGDPGDPTKTPDAGGFLGTTVPSMGRFYFGEKIATTGDGSDTPLGAITPFV